MNESYKLLLDETDSGVAAALHAEQRLFEFYGLKATSRYIPLANYGIRIRVTEVGSGKPILIVPGGAGDAFPFAPLMAELKGFRLIAVNRPGGGLSEGMDHHTVFFRKFAVDTIISVMDAFGLDQVPVLAHSMGSQWSLWTALDKPERISALALLGVPGNILDTRPPFPMRLLAVPGLNRFLINLMIPSDLEQARKSLTFMGHSKETCARLPDVMVDCQYHFPHLPHYRISMLSLMERTNRLRGPRPEARLTAEELKQIRQSVLLLWGDHDPIGKFETGRRVAGLLPSSEFHVIEGAGHLPWMDDPTECGRLTKQFFLRTGEENS